MSVFFIDEDQPTKNKFYIHEVEIKKELEELFKTRTEASNSKSSYLILTDTLIKSRKEFILADKDSWWQAEDIESIEISDEPSMLEYV